MSAQTQKKAGLSKINQTILDIINEMVEIEETEHHKDFDTRDGKICANIKVYEWMDEDDVKKVIADNNLSHFEEEILEEFDEDRLNSIYNHNCEDWVTQWKEQYESNCDLSDFNKCFMVYSYASQKDMTLESAISMRPNMKYYFESNFEKARKFKTREAWVKNVIEKNKQEYDEWDKRNKIDKFEVWQYGRSGGWLSICDDNEVDFSFDDHSDLIYDLKDFPPNGDNQKFNEILQEYDYFSKHKPDLIKELRQEITKVNEKLEAINSIVSEIEESKKYFKDSVLERLIEEINDFVGEEDLSSSNVSIDVDGNLVKTSLGISVRLNDFKEAFMTFAHNAVNMKDGDVMPINVKVGNYFVNRAVKLKDDILIKAGCHKFSYNQIQETLAL